MEIGLLPRRYVEGSKKTAEPSEIFVNEIHKNQPTCEGHNFCHTTYFADEVQNCHDAKELEEFIANAD